MQDPEANDAAHSSPSEGERRRLRWQFFGSLVLLGLLFGLMLGRLVRPEPAAFVSVEAVPGGLDLRLTAEAAVRAEHREGTYALLIDAATARKVLSGRTQIDGLPASWRLRGTDQGLVLRLVAARPLTGRWQGDDEGDGWRLEIRASLTAPE